MTNYSALKSTGAPGFPPGFIIPWGQNSIPAGFLLCNGDPKNRADFPDLFAAIGTTYGEPSGTEFNLPNLDGKSLLFQASGNNTPGSGNVGTTAGNANVNVDPTNHVTLTNNQTATGAIVVSGNVANHTLTESELPSLTGDALFLNRGGGAQNHNIVANTNGIFSTSSGSAGNNIGWQGEGGNQSTKLRISFGGGGAHDHNHNIQVNSQTVNLSDAANTVVLGHNAFSVLSPSTRLRAVIKT
tara:strand:- start:12646 stop:13371 length:726 start_codon:yes stop_codon:yes gene_type:complete